MVNGATPLLIGRPILAAWKAAGFGARGEYLLRLDEGVETDPKGSTVTCGSKISVTCGSKNLSLAAVRLL